MARIARVVVPGSPHHVTQRGNRRQRTFFSDKDYSFYLKLMAEWCTRRGVEIWAYCLMPNHVHMIAVPQKEGSLRRAIGEAHRRYTLRVNTRERWQGHLWQERFASFVMDERHLLCAARYIELNPVRSRLVQEPKIYPWSSAAAHIAGRNDVLVKASPLLKMVNDWQEFLSCQPSEQDIKMLRNHEKTGRPLGSDAFVTRIEKKLGRMLRPSRRGPKPRMGKRLQPEFSILSPK